jgi:C_GCAxxG_C_C family probable redox protein
MVDRQKLLQLHAAGFNCAQCVAAYYADEMGMDEKTALAATGGFGGGFRNADICGAAAAAVMVLGTKAPHVNENAMDEKMRITELTKDFTRRFVDKYGYLDCRDLKGKGKTPCDELICGAAEILDEMLDSEALR